MENMMKSCTAISAYTVANARDPNCEHIAEALYSPNPKDVLITATEHVLLQQQTTAAQSRIHSSPRYRSVPI